MRVHSLTQTSGNSVLSIYPPYYGFVYYSAHHYRILVSETKWEDMEHIVTYGIEDCMRLQTNDTPLFLADNSFLSGGYNSAKTSLYEKEKVLYVCISNRNNCAYIDRVLIFVCIAGSGDVFWACWQPSSVSSQQRNAQCIQYGSRDLLSDRHWCIRHQDHPRGRRLRTEKVFRIYGPWR